MDAKLINGNVKLELVYLHKGKYCVNPRMVYRNFYRISLHFRSIRNFFSSQNGCRRPFWMTENHFWSHFSPFQININFCFTKWLPATILDDRKSISIAFLAISDQYTTFFICFDFFFTKWLRPFWMTENHFWSHFSPFQININFCFTKWLPATILDDRKSISIAFLAISDQYATFFFRKMAASCHFGWPKITFDRISRHFRSIRNFYLFWFFFHKMAADSQFGWPKITFDRISRHFRSIHNF